MRWQLWQWAAMMIKATPTVGPLFKIMPSNCQNYKTILTLQQRLVVVTASFYMWKTILVIRIKGKEA